MTQQNASVTALKKASDLFPEALLVDVVDGKPMTTTVKVAQHFKKRHKNVLQAVENLLLDNEENVISRLNFQPRDYKDSRGKTWPMFLLGKKEFAVLSMRFTGKTVLNWQLDFFEAFEVIEAALRASTARYAAALDQLRPNLRPVVEATQQDHSRRAIAAPLGKSCASVSYHRGVGRRLGLLAGKHGGAV